MRVTATAGDDATLNIDGAPSLMLDGVPMGPRAYWAPLDFRSIGATGMMWDFEPWRAPDRNPMPRVAPFPRVQRVEASVLKVAREAGRRCRNAWQSLRGEEWPDW